MQKSTGHTAKPQGQAPENQNEAPKPKVDVLKNARLSVVAQNRLGQRPPAVADNPALQRLGTPVGVNGGKPVPGSGLPSNNSTRKSTGPIIVPPARRRAARAAKESNGTKADGKSSSLEADTTSRRQRVRPETKLQMLERLTNPLISLHEASVLLSVCPATVRRYTAAGLLTHVRTEGQQRRFYLRDVLALMRQLESRRH